MNKNFIILILAALIALLFTTKTCNNDTGGKSNINDTTVVHSDTLWFHDTNIVNVDSLVVRYKTIPKDSTIYNIIDSLKLDSAIIAREYFSKNYYDDTLYIDSITTVRIQENTFMNLVENRSVLLIRKTPTIINTIKVNKRFKWKWYLGANLSGSEDFLDIGPSLTIIPNKRWLVGGSYGLREKTINLNIGYKIR